jgi:hypothetical protein
MCQQATSYFFHVELLFFICSGEERSATAEPLKKDSNPSIIVRFFPCFSRALRYFVTVEGP